MSASVTPRHWADIASETVTAGIERKYLTGDRVTVAHFQLKRVLKFAIDGREIVLREGDVLQIPSWIEHEVEVLEDSFAIDVFSPVRQDWIDKTDDYFRR